MAWKSRRQKIGWRYWLPRLAGWALASSALVGVWAVLRAAAESARPNVLLISIDAMRPDHLSCYGYARKTSPQIDQLAEQGVVFENHISSTSWTLPAHAALFTSLADSVHGCTDTDKRLADGAMTLAEQFAAAGYKTVGFFSGPYLHPAFGLGQCFEHYENCTSYARALDTSPASQWSMDLAVMQSSHRDITSPHVYESFKKWLDENGDSKFFMFVHMWDVHFDFVPPPPYDTMFDPDYTGDITGENVFFDPRIHAEMPQRDKDHLMALYDGEIRWTDYHLGKMIDDLKRSGVLDRTVVAITSDHGTEFFEHSLIGHRMTLYDEVIRIPLILYYPRELAAGVRVRSQTRILDVGPTLLELAGVDSDLKTMGRSLVALARDPATDFDIIALSELYSVGRRIRSIRGQGWKFMDLIHKSRRMYFDLTVDPGERRPQLDLSQTSGRKLEELYDTIVEDVELWRVSAAPGADQSAVPDDVLQQLKHLGYVGSGQP